MGTGGRPRPPARPRLPAPGLLVCTLAGAVVRASAQAAELLGLTAEQLAARTPVAVGSLVARHLAGQASTSAVPMPGGAGWLTLHATTLSDDVVVVVEPIRPHDLAEVVVRGRGLTAREREVLALVARGRSNRQIAGASACRSGPSRTTSRRCSRSSTSGAGASCGCALLRSPRDGARLALTGLRAAGVASGLQGAPAG